MAVLNCSIVVRDDNFVTHVFNAGDTVPEWVRKQVSNPDVWASENDAVQAPAEPEKHSGVKIPPMSGRGSSASAWAAYAASQGFEVDSDAKASEIRDALESEGIPVE